MAHGQNAARRIKYLGRRSPGTRGWRTFGNSKTKRFFRRLIKRRARRHARKEMEQQVRDYLDIRSGYCI